MTSVASETDHRQRQPILASALPVSASLQATIISVAGEAPAPDELVELRGAPRRLRLDNGPKFISAALRQWVQRHGVELLHIQPRKPTQNAYIERSNRTLRTEVLDRYVFTSLREVRRMAED